MLASVSKYVHTLIAPLGGQPQIVTFTLDLLLRRAFPIGEVIVLHPHAGQDRLYHSLERLNEQFVGDRYWFEGRTITCHFRSRVLELDHQPIADITDSTGAKGARETIYRYIQQLKQQPRHIHLSITGGRRLMSILAISAAQLKFDPFDHIWHIYTPSAVQEAARDGRMMHVPPEAGVSLIEVPFIPLGSYFSGIEQIATAQTAHHHIDAQEHERCERVAQALANRRPFDVLCAFARGLAPQEVSDALSISMSTVSTHLMKIYDECRIAWNLPAEHGLTYHFLYTHFSRYFGYSE